MISKKVLRYYSECGRGFWKKQQAITHDKNCKCWKNPTLKSCVSCKFKSLLKDNNGEQNGTQFYQEWEYNNCDHSESGAPVHQDFQHIRKYCQFHETK